MLERIAAVLKLTWRHYNASLLNYDDPVGYPLPNARGELDFVRTPASIWDAEIVFFDEISRCRPDLQNKLFPILHERRVQGIRLENLRYLWAAMNLPPYREAVEQSLYRGCEQLDAARAAVMPPNMFSLDIPTSSVMPSPTPLSPKPVAVSVVPTADWKLLSIAGVASSPVESPAQACRNNRH